MLERILGIILPVFLVVALGCALRAHGEARHGVGQSAST